jgi:HrpA-like RNA helicase
MAGETLKKEFIARQKTRAYQSMSKMRESLPMYSYRSQLLKTIRENAVTVLCAETGAGEFKFMLISLVLAFIIFLLRSS